MRKMVIGGVAVLTVTTGANAGDLPRQGPCAYSCQPLYYPPPPPPPPPPRPVPYLCWCGAYAGATLGLQSGRVTNSGARPGGGTGGLEGGFNWQSGQWVAGWESDFQFSSAEDSVAANRFSDRWFGTVRGRAGVAFDNILLYGTLGFAYGRGEVARANLTETNLHTGWAGGVGVELALAPRWSVKLEYLRVDLGARHYTLTGTDNGLQSNLFRVGLNYRF